MLSWRLKRAAALVSSSLLSPNGTDTTTKVEEAVRRCVAPTPAAMRE